MTGLRPARVAEVKPRASRPPNPKMKVCRTPPLHTARHGLAAVPPKPKETP